MSAPSAKKERFTRPRQGRSRETWERLLDAAEDVISETGFAAASVQAIASRAGYTTGAFYARFPTKEAVLWALEERCGAMVEQATQALRDATDGGAGVGIVVDRIAELLSDAYLRRRGVMLSLREAAQGDRQIMSRLDALNRRFQQACVEAIRAGSAERGKVPRLRIEAGLLMLTASLRELLLRREYWHAEGASREKLVRSIQRAVAGYLEGHHE